MSIEVTTHDDPGNVAAVDIAHVATSLQQLLQERHAILRELEPRAVPSVDVVSYQSAASQRRAVEQITAALARVDAGTYGLCVRCGRGIAPGRLEVVPYAAACIDCQNNADAA